MFETAMWPVSPSSNSTITESRSSSSSLEAPGDRAHLKTQPLLRAPGLSLTGQAPGCLTNDTGMILLPDHIRPWSCQGLRQPPSASCSAVGTVILLPSITPTLGRTHSEWGQLLPTHTCKHTPGRGLPGSLAPAQPPVRPQGPTSPTRCWGAGGQDSSSWTWYLCSQLMTSRTRTLGPL